MPISCILENLPFQIKDQSKEYFLQYAYDDVKDSYGLKLVKGREGGNMGGRLN